jgi:hypothetical protein
MDPVVALADDLTLIIARKCSNVCGILLKLAIAFTPSPAYD